MVKSKHFVTDNERVLAHPYISSCLVFDVETDFLDVDTATIKFFGCYSYRYQKYYILHHDELDKVQRLIKDHRVLVGFNNAWFDEPILENPINKIDLDYKITFDCLKVLYDFERKRPNRELIIEWKGKTLGEQLVNRKLKTIAEVLEFPVLKGEINYKIFQQDSWTEEELNEIYKYLFADVDITRRLFEFLVSYFDMFREFVDDDNICKFNYIRSSTGSFSYSAFCHMAGLPLEFEDDPIKKKKQTVKYKGGFVLEPQKNYTENCLLLDYTSLYPMVYAQCNLFSEGCSCCSDDELWSGDGFFEVEGRYCSKTIGKIEKLIRKIYLKRKEYKKTKDPRGLGIKIMLNSLYGISSSPIFKSVYHKYCASDCTSIGRKIIQYSIEQFELAGYPVVYADTDSCFVELGNGYKEEALQIADRIVKDVQTHMPFPF